MTIETVFDEAIENLKEQRRQSLEWYIEAGRRLQETAEAQHKVFQELAESITEVVKKKNKFPDHKPVERVWPFPADEAWPFPIGTKAERDTEGWPFPAPTTAKTSAPQASLEEQVDCIDELLKFYDVFDIRSLVQAQAGHIKRLQEKMAFKTGVHPMAAFITGARAG